MYTYRFSFVLSDEFHYLDIDADSELVAFHIFFNTAIFALSPAVYDSFGLIGFELL